MFVLVIDFIIYYIYQLYHNTTDFQDVLTEKEFLEMPIIKFDWGILNLGKDPLWKSPNKANTKNKHSSWVSSDWVAFEEHIITTRQQQT